MSNILLFRPFFRAAVLSFLTALGATPLAAQVEHKQEWVPAREISATAPPPPHLEERLQAFANRDSDAAVAELARSFFGLLRPDYQPDDKTQADLYQQAFTRFRAGDYRGALDSYKAFTFDRLRHPAPGFTVKAEDPSKRTFIEFYNKPGELMRGVFRFQVFDQPLPKAVTDAGTDAIINYYRAGKHDAHMEDLVLQNGMPGRMNWTYMPSGIVGGTWHLPNDKDFIANAYNEDMCFTPLLVAYLQTKDPSYLKQYLGYVDDYILNYHKDLADAGILLRVSSGGAGGPSFLHIAYVVQNAPNVDQDFSSTTLARYLLQSWIDDIPLVMRGSRATAANRAMYMYGALLTEAYKQYPELKYADELLTARRRILESYAREYMAPDGTGVDYAPNYNKNYLLSPPDDIRFFQAMKNPPAWFNADWVKELEENQMKMARYLIRYFAPNGTLPGYKDPTNDLREDTVGKKSYVKKALPAALEDPNNQAVMAKVLGQPGGADPGFTSESYPYGGYYFMRENWNPDARFLYFHDYRPASSGNWRHQKNVAVQAFGQSMLNPHRWESPLLVDGAGVMFSGDLDLYPASYVAPNHPVLYGEQDLGSAWQDPLPNRWLTSKSFDFAEGSLKVPYAEKFADRAPVFIDDVSHARQVLFLRAAGAWVVTDRIRAEKPHDYRLQWSFEPDRLNPVGWDPGFARKPKTAEPPRKGYSKDQIVLDAKTQTIKTTNPTLPDLSIYQAASVPLHYEPDSVTQGTDAWYGNSYMAGTAFQTKQQALVTSLLYPRRTVADDLASFKQVHVEEGAGFDAVTPDGVNMAYRASLDPAQLTAANVEAHALVLAVCPAGRDSASGIALDCTRFSVGGKQQEIPSADFEFQIDSGGKTVFTPIYRPLERVTILPEEDVFLNEITVTLQHPAKDVDIRYTVDGTEPTLDSPLYTGPLKLTQTTRVRARAFRKGITQVPPTNDSVLASVDQSAVFTKAEKLFPAMAVAEASLKPGLKFDYYEDDWTLSMLKLPILKPLSSGVAAGWMDVSARRTNSNCYGFVYQGFIKIPKTGIYTFHGPFELFDVGKRAGYDLQLILDGQEWYPTTRSHNYGNWSVPLEAGLHSLKITYLDVRRGAKEASSTFDVYWQSEKPDLAISGPGLEPQPVPSDWLVHKSP